MKITVTIAALTLAGLSGPLLNLQDGKKPQDAPGAQDPAAPGQAEWATYVKLMQPSEHHKFFDQLIGNWETEMGFVMGGVPSPKTKGKATYRWQYDGLWLVRDIDGQLMGKPLRSTTVFGYDNYKKKYVFSNTSSRTSNMLFGEGMTDRAKKSIFFYGPMDEPLTGEHDKPVKYALRIIDADTHVEEVHDLAIGETNTKVVETTFRRVK